MNMRYLVVCKDHAFFTDWFSKENNWCDDIVCVCDILLDTITYDGENWQDVDYDHL